MTDNNDYTNGYRDGWRDGFNEGKKQEAPYVPYVPQKPQLNKISHCPKCGMRLEGVMGFVCASPDCPTFLNISC
jgi:hypothetical protein